MYYRVHRAGEPLYTDQQSWPWGYTPEEARREGELLDGVSCCTSVYGLVMYFAQNTCGAVEEVASVEEMLGCACEVVAFEGTDLREETDAHEYTAHPTHECGRYTWEEVIAAYDDDEEHMPEQYRIQCPAGFRLPE